MKHLSVTTQFQKQLATLLPADRDQTIEALKTLKSSIHQGKIPQGLGFKKINGDKYEIRIDIRLRIVLKKDGDFLVCVLLGNHDQVRQYLKNFRNR